ncbi:hypothetical protein V6N12_009209 [Hibiscus sabdariffa]|uniref:Uncharacterized protein n=1 Tax=Hibiscus sabdariffa TaxID=183260 RepID=A0ABR2AMZ7_9ROSI
MRRVANGGFDGGDQLSQWWLKGAQCVVGCNGCSDEGSDSEVLVFDGAGSVRGNVLVSEDSFWSLKVMGSEKGVSVTVRHNGDGSMVMRKAGDFQVSNGDKNCELQLVGHVGAANDDHGDNS